MFWFISAIPGCCVEVGRARAAARAAAAALDVARRRETHLPRVAGGAAHARLHDQGLCKVYVLTRAIVGIRPLSLVLPNRYTANSDYPCRQGQI